MSEENSYFDGSVIEYVGWSILYVLIIFFSLGLATPWAVCWFQKWKMSHTVVNGHRLQFNGSGGNLFGYYILWWFLTIITLGIYSFWLLVAMEKWKAKNVTFEK